MIRSYLNFIFNAAALWHYKNMGILYNKISVDPRQFCQPIVTVP